MPIYQEAAPISRAELEDIGVEIRRLLGYTEDRWLPVAHIIEHALPQVFGDDFAFQVGELEELGGNHGYADPDQKILVLRSDVYDGLVAGKGRDRMTGMHEVSHLFLHPSRRLFRRMRDEPPPPFRQAEWQAKCLAGATMMPASLLGGCLSIREIVNEFGVSADAAEYRLRQLGRRLAN